MSRYLDPRSVLALAIASLGLIALGYYLDSKEHSA